MKDRARIAGLKHISVTIDMLRTFPDLDITNERDLRIALYRVGFNATRDADGTVTGLSPYTMLTGKLVRCANMPWTCRATVIFVGQMDKDYKHSQIYNGIEILDVGVVSSADMQLVTDLPYDLPITDKVNTRKYTKRRDKESMVEISYSAEDESRLGNVFGLED